MNVLQNIVTKVNSFENEIPIILALVLLITVASVSLEWHEIYELELFPDYNDNVKPWLDSCDPSDYPDQKRGALKWWFICASEHWLGNARIIPFIFSTLLIPITYSFISELTKYRTVGLIATLSMVTSGLFLNFNTTATYEQSWVVFLLLSSWLTIKGNRFAPCLFLLSFLAKPLALIYLPLLIITAWQLAPNNRRFLIFSLTIICGIIVSLAFVGGIGGSFGSDFSFNPDKLIAGFYGWWFYLNSAMLIAITIPLIIYKLADLGLNKENKSALVILSYIVGIIISVPLIEGFTDQLNHAYRFIPLVIFSGAGLGLIVMNWVRHQSKFYVKYHLNN